MYGVTDNFNVGIGVHQVSTLSPYLFSVVMDEVTKKIQGNVLRCMMFADDTVLVGENLEKINNRLDEWLALEGKRLKISRIKQSI